MTENEAKEYMENEVECIKRASHCDRDCLNCELVKEETPLIESYDIAIQALDEIQQYRAIGTVEELKTIKALCKNQENLISAKNKQLAEYEAIGTIEEFKAFKEKNTPKKRGMWKSGHTCCPTCERGVVTEDRFCCYCGQALKPKEI